MRAQTFKISLLLVSFVLFVGATNANPPPISAKPERLQLLHETLLNYVDDAKVKNMSYGLWQSGEPITSGFRGAVHEHSAETVSETTIHRIYSMTKPVTAIGLLILLEEGHFALEDPITKFLPEFADTEVLADYDAKGEMFTYRPVREPTMAQLLSHTAGFVYGNQGLGFLEDQ